MPVNDRGIDVARHSCGRPPASEERHRRDRNRHAAQMYIGPQRTRVSEDMPSFDRRVVERMKVHALVNRSSRQLRMPRQNHVDGVSACSQACRDGPHEGADRIPVEARIRRRHHHHSVSGVHGFRLNHERNCSRHGMKIDSSTTLVDSFDTPWRRSTKMMGTSPIRAPRRDASKSISTRKA